MWADLQVSAAKKPAASAKGATGGKTDKTGKVDKSGAGDKPGPARSEPGAPEPAKPETGKPSFMTRFTAWWHGYELEAAGQGKAATKPEQRPKPTAGEPEPADDSPSQPPSDPRLRIAQMVWSAGFAWPGGEDLALELAKPLGLNASSTLVEIGSGLGGGTRAIAEKLGTYVTGFDLDPAVVAEAMTQAEIHGLEEKAKVLLLDPRKPSLRKDFFRAALVREALYRIADKNVLLDDLIGSLKRDQPIVVFDLFAGSTSPGKPLAEWAALEPHPVHLCRLEDLKAMLAEQHVEIRVEQDDSELYCAMALRAWGDFVERLNGPDMTKDAVVPLVREVEVWARRIAALQSGDLKVWRVVGIKRTPVR
jgi:hypothetical protein